ncbi:myb family transcription factor PHL8 [Sesamum indicum]|uniref:Myb family transcription factor PHL8 n=1 Tax=Sesamum indicum TaxID=4182 RepID=A0A6I9SUJ8_SESIN|nr:myb family transcription factor PHL8 [Sesamum indicum]
MAFQNVHDNEMSLVLSSDAKPRLKWTQELHQRFVDAVNQLGGAEKATPKSLMRIMGIHGLTLYHLKSHLQKYRLGRSQQSQIYHHSKPEDYGGKQTNLFASTIFDEAKEPTNENLQITQALQMQMEVQRKLHEQIEVQRHLQLRIEAQGKYLQSVLRKAQETLSEYSSCSIEAECAKAQLSQLASMVDSGCPSSSFSVLTESESSMLEHERNKLFGRNGCSHESSLTSSESSWRQDETEPQHEVGENCKHENVKMNNETAKSIELSLMEMHPVEKGPSEIQATNNEKSGARSSSQQVNRISWFKDIDLNCKSMTDFGSGPRAIDLNDKGLELFNGNF